MLSKHNNKDGSTKIREVVALLDKNSTSSESEDESDESNAPELDKPLPIECNKVDSQNRYNFRHNQTATGQF